MSQTFKEEIVALRKQDKSIVEIMKITGRAKTTIYPYIRGIPLSATRTALYKAESGKRIRKFAIARKGKSRRTFTSFGIWTPGNVLLLGHFIFDGELLRGKCVYNNRSEALLSRVEKHMKKYYAYPPTRYTNPLTGVGRISYHNVALGNYMQQKAHKLLKEIPVLSLRLQKEFLRAFFDDEGCMDFRPQGNRRKIRGYQKDISVLQLVQTLLENIDIPSRIEAPNEVTISGKENLSRFEKEINFSLGVYMNGNRTNSRWKKNLEKRQLLRMAIESFKN